MTTLDELKQARRDFAEVMAVSRGPDRTKQISQDVTRLAFRVRSLSDKWYAEEVHRWSHLTPTTKIRDNWDRVLDWCHQFVGEDDYLVYLPKGMPNVICLRNPGHATYIKLTFG